MLRCFDLLKGEARFVGPIAPLGGCPRSVLRHSFGPKVLEVDQNEARFAYSQKFQTGAQDFMLRDGAVAGKQALAPEKLDQSIVGFAPQFFF